MEEVRSRLSPVRRAQRAVNFRVDWECRCLLRPKGPSGLLLTRNGDERSARGLDVSILGEGTGRRGERKKGQRGPGKLPVVIPLPPTAPGGDGGKRGKVSGFCVPFVPQVTAAK